MWTGAKAGPSPGALLDLFEQAWAARLAGRTLVAEAEPEAQADVMAAVRRALIAHTPETIARRWPACLLLALTEVVAAAYGQG